MRQVEFNTDVWVLDLLKDVGIENVHCQGSDIPEINEALKTASKAKNGNVGRPEFIFVNKDFLVVIENKASILDHVRFAENDDKEILQDEVSTKKYAVNGALHYGIHLAKNTGYKKIFAIGVSGDKTRHRITPIFINERGEYQLLQNIESFILFSESRIENYY